MKKRKFACIPAIFIMIAIFYFSAQHAEQSTQSSDYVVNQFYEWNAVFEKVSFHTLTFIVRKLAHTLEYAILGISIAYYVKQFQLSRKKILLYSIMFSCLYAISDELHQYFVPGRSCELRDVLIDTNGAFLGISCYLLLLRYWKRKSDSK